MADADVALHLVHVVRLAVNAVPAIETGGFEVALHLLLLGGFLGLGAVEKLLGGHRFEPWGVMECGADPIQPAQPHRS